MSGAAFRALSAAYALFLIELRIGFKQAPCKKEKGLAKESGQIAGKVQVLRVRKQERGKIFRNRISCKLNLKCIINFC